MTDFSSKSVKMRQFFKTCGYPDSFVNTGRHRTQQIDRQSALQTSQKEKNDRIPFIITFMNYEVKSIVLKNFKLVQNDSKNWYILVTTSIAQFSNHIQPTVLDSLCRRANAWNVSSRIFLSWPKYRFEELQVGPK